MNFGTYHIFQCPPWMNEEQVFAEELERIAYSEALGFDSVWVPEQHFYPYSLCGDAMQMATYIAGITRRVKVGTAVVNLSFTHPLRFAERVAVLDRVSGGRARIGVGRGYQWPQYKVFGVDIDETREIFNEALDIVLQAFSPVEEGYDGKYFRFPEVRIWPVPQRSPAEILLHTAVSPPSVEASIRRGLPAILSRTFDRLDTEAAWFRGYMAKVEAAGADRAMFQDRTTVMKYVFVAPTKAEAQEISRQPWEWDFQTLQKLTTPAPGAMPKAHEMYLDRAASGWPDGYDYADWAENVFIYDDPQGCAEKIAVLRDAGVRNLILWMGIGGVRHDLIKRSMRLFAEGVMPKFV